MRNELKYSTWNPNLAGEKYTPTFEGTDNGQGHWNALGARDPRYYLSLERER
jgi:hypothetical protein